MTNPSVVPTGAVHVFETIESHTAGNPTRTILSGAPALVGATMLERLADLRDKYEWVRTSLMFEPRGSSVMSGCVLMQPCDPNADVGVVFIEASGYPPMCGHDTIGLVTVLIETNRVAVTGPTVRVVLDTPAGLVETVATVEDNRVTSVSFYSTPSFLLHQDAVIPVPDVGPVTVDIAWGGNFYALVDAASVGIDLDDPRVGGRIALAAKIRGAVNSTFDVRHPLLEGVTGLTHVSFVGPPINPAATARTSVIMPPGGADRSPCGTGTAARTASLVARGELAVGESLVHESITGGLFSSTPVENVDVGGLRGVRSRITGRAFITGFARWTVDPADPLAKGFLVL